MNGDRNEDALARIAVALARIEAAARAPRGSVDAAAGEQLRLKHDRLRAAVTDSLAQLDTMLDGPRG